MLCEEWVNNSNYLGMAKLQYVYTCIVSFFSFIADGSALLLLFFSMSGVSSSWVSFQLQSCLELIQRSCWQPLRLKLLSPEVKQFAGVTLPGRRQSSETPWPKCSTTAYLSGLSVS